MISAVLVSTALLAVAAAAPLFVRRPREGAPASTGRLRAGLVAGQVAHSFVLMIATTLAVRSLLHLQGLDTGFTTIDVQTMRVDLHFSKYHDGRSIAAFWQEVERRFAALPGVVGVGGTGVVPFDRHPLASLLDSVEGRGGEQAHDARLVTPRANCEWRRRATSRHSASASWTAGCSVRKTRATMRPRWSSTISSSVSSGRTR